MEMDENTSKFLEMGGNAGNGVKRWKWLEKSEMDECFFLSFFSASEATTVEYEVSLSIVLPRKFR